MEQFTRKSIARSIFVIKKMLSVENDSLMKMMASYPTVNTKSRRQCHISSIYTLNLSFD